MKKKITKILSALFITIFALTTVSFAEFQFVPLEKSNAYEEWESLSEEERAQTIQPSYYSISIKNSIRRSRYNMLLAGNTSLESEYDLSKLYNLIVKNQKQTGSCWAFSTTSMLESVVYRKNLLSQEYSPYHMEYTTYQMYNRVLGAGGNINLAMAYMANGRGPVLESDFTMESVYDEENNTDNEYYLTDIENVDLNKTAQLKVNQTAGFPSIYKEYTDDGTIKYTDASENEYTEQEVEAARTEIKTHIKTYGAVTATMYIDIAINTGGEFVSDYYDSTNNIFCCTDSSTYANHQVTIVGWNDNKKAYIVQNSYGEAFGNNGYFYISYDDAHIEEWIYGIKDIEELTANNYDNIYYYDDLGMTNALSLGTTDIYYANVFSREASTEGKGEYINEVGLYMMTTSGIEIYVNSEDGELDESKLKLVSSGEILESGYHVIKLNASEDTKLTGEKFAIAVKATNQEGTYIPIESNLKESGFSFSSTPYDTATANLGESFFSSDGKNWYEINNQKVGYIVTLKNTNVCVRAFTKYVDAPTEVAVTGVNLDKTSMTLKEGETDTLTATVLPTDATNKNVTWTSSNTSVATISNGVVTAVNAGTARITVKTEDGNYIATCNVTVEAKTISVTGVSLNKNTLTLKEGETESLTATVLPTNATNKNVSWSSSNTAVATVENGVVTALKEGAATITVKTEDGNHTATCSVTVEAKTIGVTGVSLNKTSETIKVGETLSLVATVLPTNATNKNVTWTSSDTSVATVSGGVVTAIKAGTATITVKAGETGNYAATCKVTVEANTPAEVNVTSVSLNKTLETIKVGETLSLVATVLPTNATNKNVSWSSSNTAVATVSGGVVTAIKAGTATITVKTEDGNYTATCSITVEANTVNVTGVSLNKTSETIKVGETLSLVATVLPTNATNKNVTWTSSDTSVATVSGGVVTAIKAGTATITVTTEDGKHTATCKITVEEKEINVTGINITVESVELEEGATFSLEVEISPSNATNKNITWESSDETVVRIVNGVLTAVKPGTATITVTSEDGGFTATCTITVKKTSVVKVESIKLNKTELQMQVSDKATLTVTFNPELPTNVNVKWESSNSKVATVDENGIVTAVGKGTAVITATSEDGGHVAECTVTVTKKVDDADDIYKDSGEDTSTSDKPLPNTGITTIVFFVAATILISMGYSFIKYRKLRDVK